MKSNTAPLRLGDRVRLVSMPMDPDPIPVGTLGTVLRVHDHKDWTQVEVAWDNGRQLMLSLPDDCVALIPYSQESETPS